MISVGSSIDLSPCTYVLYVQYLQCMYIFIFTYSSFTFKGIVSRDFEGLQMILMDRIGVPDVPLEFYSFLNLHLHIAF